MLYPILMKCCLRNLESDRANHVALSRPFALLLEDRSKVLHATLVETSKI